MQHDDFLVDILDTDGTVIGTKKRSDIDKKRDLYHSVFVLVFTAGKQLVLTKIPENSSLPNLYTGKLGCSAATILRHWEHTEEAARRALADDLDIEFAKLSLLGTEMMTLADEMRRKITAYYCFQPHTISFGSNEEQEFETVDRAEIEKLIEKPDNFAPTFIAIWERYNQRLPF